VDELPLLVQPRFLRFLDQERDARVVASADVSLLTRVGHGHFRADLAERLTLVQLMLPAIR
jgi:DNA-binding NtrC family response regulator